MNVGEHWYVQIKSEDKPRDVIVTKIDTGWVYMKDASNALDVVKRGRFSERIADVEFLSLLKA